jgi:hypothetical protein
MHVDHHYSYMPLLEGGEIFWVLLMPKGNRERREHDELGIERDAQLSERTDDLSAVEQGLSDRVQNLLSTGACPSSSGSC